MNTNAAAIRLTDPDFSEVGRETIDYSSHRSGSNNIHNSIKLFEPISLNELNEKAEMLDRIDNKYIVSGQCLQSTLSELSNGFDVLEIDHKREFRYSTQYFDDAENRGYYDHHQRKRKRCKARVREYVDAGLCYLEVKTNEKRSTTLKRRLVVKKPLKALDEKCYQFVDSCYQSSYDTSFEKKLSPVILINYQRITLVAKEGGERLTIDANLSFHSEDEDYIVSDNTYIVETKSARGNGIADKVLRSFHVQPTKRVSKYCMGMALTGQVNQFNGFLPALRRLNMNSSIKVF